MSHSLYTVMASLPHLVSFERAVQLPISEIQVDKRIRLLLPPMRELTVRLRQFLTWHYHSSSVTDAHIAGEYEEVLRRCEPYPGVRQLIVETMDQRTIVVALRLRHNGITPDEAGEAWGVGTYKVHIERHWHEADFRLAHRYRWIAEVKRCLEDEEPFEMERLFIRLIWRRADKLRDAEPFGYGGLIAYLFQWGLTHKWLGYEEARAANRFKTLISEVVGEYRSSKPFFG